ncbi:MAG: hypothetical protein MZW92_06920 [Comamonadaceae bacterium]|nr:hypothetical protein [Comamonadaceae bacterium]
MLARGYTRGVRRADLPPDPGLRRVRLPGEPRRQLRAAGLRLVVAEVPRAGRLLRRAARLASRWASTRRRRSCATRVDHGVEVRPIEVTASDWHCTLEPSASDRGGRRCASASNWCRASTRPPAQRIVAARARAAVRRRRRPRPPRAARPTARSTRWPRADALAPLTGHRRRALWTTLGLDADAPRAAPLAARLRRARSRRPSLLAPTEGQDIVADYAHTALTLRRHPLALLRDALRRHASEDRGAGQRRAPPAAASAPPASSPAASARPPPAA